MRLKYLIRKEFIQIRRNSFLPKMIVMFPIVLICVAPWITNMEVKNINVTIVDNDHSVLSQRLIHRTEQSNYFHFQGTAPKYDDAQQMLEQNKVDVIAVIPQHYERDLTMGRQPQVYIAANSVNGTKGMMGASYLSQIVTRNAEGGMRNAEGGTQNAGSGAALSAFRIPQSAFQIPQSASKSLYNKYQDYKLFMIPALIAIIVVMMCGFMPALNIVGEKEEGTIEQINVTPVRKWEFILAKLIPYWIIGLFVFTISLLLAWLVYGFTPAGNLGLLYISIMLLALVMSGLGLVVSNYSSQMQQAMLVMWFIMVCFLLLSGLFTPVQSMPDWAQTLTMVNPMRYFIDAMRTLYVRGGTFQSVWLQMTALAAFALVIDSWAVVSYKKNG